ncbi:hypothetical protein SAMN02910436_02548 [Ruminococcaceae bacterium P7]|nr:hypothetical protein SAMN02910436_02548 [Ruminococcaceae bacterium P7]
MKRIRSVFLIGLIFLLPFMMPTAMAANNSNSSFAAKQLQPIPHDGTVQVTFATNSFLEIEYFFDENLTQPIDTKNCYLNKGESIYISGIDVQNAKSNLYSFSEFRFVEYDLDGKRKNSTSTQVTTGLIYTLPNEFDGQGISVLPIGAYKDRELKFDSYYFDTKGELVELDSKMWDLNESGDLFANGSQTVSPVESYTISFNYSPYKDSYYFVKSSPDCFYHKETDSKVVFPKVNSNEEAQKYRVEMHPFITLRIKDTEHHWIVDDWFDKGAIKKIEKNSEVLEKYKKNSEEFKREEIDIKNLKTSDTITITVGKDYKLVCPNLNLTNSIPVEDGYQYTVRFPDNNEKKYQIEISTRNSNSEGRFEPREVSNGTISVSYENGGEIKSGVELPADGQSVVLKISGNDGFYVSGNDTESGIYKKTMSFSDYQKPTNKKSSPKIELDEKIL